MFAEGDVLKNKHTGGIVTVTDVLHIKSAKNPVLQVLDAEGQVFRLDKPSASHWVVDGDPSTYREYVDSYEGGEEE
jgi:hypothetical protein